MHFIFISTGSLGDFLPLVALARELETRGHRCAFVANPLHCPGIARSGLRAIAAGSPECLERLGRNPDLHRPGRAFALLMQAVLEETPEIFRAIEAEARSDSVLVFRSIALGARIAEEKLGLAGCFVILSAAELWSHHDPPTVGAPAFNWMMRRSPLALREKAVGWLRRRYRDGRLIAALNPLREKLGLPPLGQGAEDWHMGSRRVLAAFPPWMGSPQPDWPAQIRQTGFLYAPFPAGGPPDGRLATFIEAGAPPVLISLGSGMRGGRYFIDDALDACRRLGRRPLVLSPLQEAFETDGKTFLFAPFLPHHLVLPHCCAVIHHGGSGTTAQALRHATPQLVLGAAFDHPEMGNRITRLGAGRWAFLPRLSPSRLRALLAEVAASPAIREGARAAAARVHPEAWLRESCDILEELDPRS